MKKRPQPIAVLAVTILAAGFCALGMTGCGKKSGAKNEISLDDLNRAAGMMSMAGHAPQTVDELTNFPAVKGRPFPTPPDGKKFAVDPANHQIVVVAQ